MLIPSFRNLISNKHAVYIYIPQLSLCRCWNGPRPSGPTEITVSLKAEFNNVLFIVSLSGSKSPHFLIPFHGKLVYLHGWWMFYGFHVGKSPMDPMDEYWTEKPWFLTRELTGLQVLARRNSCFWTQAFGDTNLLAVQVTSLSVNLSHKTWRIFVEYAHSHTTTIPISMVLSTWILTPLYK